MSDLFDDAFNDSLAGPGQSLGRGMDKSLLTGLVSVVQTGVALFEFLDKKGISYPDDMPNELLGLYKSAIREVRNEQSRKFKKSEKRSRQRDAEKQLFGDSAEDVDEFDPDDLF